jgi:hypothetical protein
VLLGPTPGLRAGRRETLVASLVDAAVVAGIPILELIVPSGRGREGERRVRTGREEISWPCSLGELERCIEGACAQATEGIGARAGIHRPRPGRHTRNTRVTRGEERGTRFTAEVQVESNIKRAVSLAIEELTPTRCGERNGPRTRNLLPPAGKIERLEVPRAIGVWSTFPSS